MANSPMRIRAEKLDGSRLASLFYYILLMLTILTALISLAAMVVILWAASVMGIHMALKSEVVGVYGLLLIGAFLLLLLSLWGIAAVLMESQVGLFTYGSIATFCAVLTIGVVITAFCYRVDKQETWQNTKEILLVAHCGTWQQTPLIHYVVKEQNVTSCLELHSPFSNPSHEQILAGVISLVVVLLIAIFTVAMAFYTAKHVGEIDIVVVKADQIPQEDQNAA